MREAVIVSAARTAIGRAKKGSLRDTRPEYFASEMIKGLVQRTPGLDPATVSDVVLGCAMPEGEQGMNVARLIALAAGFPTSVPAMTVNRFCSSGSQTIALASDTIRAGNGDIIIAGGVESMSMVAMGGNKPIAYPGLMDTMPNAYAAMGTTAEVVAKRFGITREAQDEFAYNSHMKAVAALESGGLPTKSCRSTSASVKTAHGATSISTPTRARAPTPRSRVWPGSSRSSIQWERSPPATRRRSTTAPRRS